MKPPSCDFCERPNVRPSWVFDVDRFLLVIHVVDGSHPDQHIDMARQTWAACDECCNFIHSGNIEPIKELLFIEKKGVVQTEKQAMALRRALEAHLTGAIANRVVGPPRRWDIIDEAVMVVSFLDDPEGTTQS